MKSQNIKTTKQRNTPNSQKGSGDYYGTAIKQKVGRPVSLMMEIKGNNKVGKKPKTLA